MYAPVKEIMTDLLKYNLSSDEALLVLCITREDIRMLTSEWRLSDEDITCVMQRSLHLTGRKRQVSRMAGGYAACQSARKTMQAAACGEGPGPRFAQLPVLSPPDSDGIHLQRVSISVGVY
ncbi:hypothetical protein F3Z39_07845 [Salmonella enterica]|nr:hypothetical protein [Salmonella enterica]